MQNIPKIVWIFTVIVMLSACAATNTSRVSISKNKQVGTSTNFEEDFLYKHSLDMSEHQFLEHTSSNGDTLVERMQGVNYAWRAVGENIAHNQKSIGQAIEDWLSSPGHCSNIMSSDYSQTGVAVVNSYWTQVYATPK